MIRVFYFLLIETYIRTIRVFYLAYVRAYGSNYGQNPSTRSAVIVLTGNTSRRTRARTHGQSSLKHNASAAPIGGGRRHKSDSIFSQLCCANSQSDTQARHDEAVKQDCLTIFFVRSEIDEKSCSNNKRTSILGRHMLRSRHCYEHTAEGNMTLMWRKTDRLDVRSQRTWRWLMQLPGQLILVSHLDATETASQIQAEIWDPTLIYWDEKVGPCPFEIINENKCYLSMSRNYSICVNKLKQFI